MKRSGYLVTVGFLALLFIVSCAGVQDRTLFKKLPNGGEVNGPRSVENIEKNLQVLKPRLEFFYSKRIKRNPDLQGVIEFIFDVDSKGNVTFASIGKATTRDPDFNDEVLAALSNHKFDEWTQGRDKTEVIYPYTFSLLEFPKVKEEQAGPVEQIKTEQQGAAEKEKEPGEQIGVEENPETDQKPDSPVEEIEEEE